MKLLVLFSVVAVAFATIDLPERARGGLLGILNPPLPLSATAVKRYITLPVDHFNKTNPDTFQCKCELSC